MSEVNIDNINYDFDFLLDDKVSEKEVVLEPYKVLIADDDDEVHASTKMILRDFTFEGRKLELFEAYNTKETIEIMTENPDMAIILLDVVMDSNDSGLKLVDYIRNTLKNILVRIIIRTGQPGEAPEEKVIVDYDINDYLMKTEITMQRIFTSLYQSLRSFRDILRINENKKGLEKIIKSSSKIFVQDSMQDFFNCILKELMSFRKEDSSVCFRTKEIGSGLVYIDDIQNEKVIAATGEYEKFLGTEISKNEELAHIREYINELDLTRSEDIIEVYNGFLVWVKTHNHKVNFIFIQNNAAEYDIELIKVFLLNYSYSLDSYIANQQVSKTQVEIINTLGDAIEKRSHETANHVKRVSEISYFMAKKLSMSQEECDLIKITSTMHDVGKIGILDNVLMKAGKLTEEEFEIIKTHTLIGHKIFCNSDLIILRKTADICLYHHERYDGTGYPNGVKGEKIPLEAKIVSLVDVFDALTHDRCYKTAWTIEEAVDYIKSQNMKYFDPIVTGTFIDNLEEIKEIFKTYND